LLIAHRSIAVMVLLACAIACSAAIEVHATDSALSGATVTTLAEGPVKALPAGKVYVNILEFRQLPGASFGPHYHIAAMEYTLHGTSTISFSGAAARSVGPGEATFIPALAVHTHQNLGGQIGAGAIAVSLVVLVILLCAATWMRGGSRRITIAVLSLLLVGGGALTLTGPSVDDYYLIAVRPDSQRVLPMPRPDGRVVYSSPDFDPVPAGPYVETLSAITVPAGARYDSPGTPGPDMLFVAEGSADVQIGATTTQISGDAAAFAQTGQTVAIVNQGSGTLKVLEFAITGVPTAP
jgi:quercetin dioxygenase-like cupin family protein